MAAGLADRVVVLEGGAVVEEGPAGKVLASPAHPSTQCLVERVPWREIRTAPRAPVGAVGELQIERLTKAFSIPVLRGVDLRVGPGEVVGVAGVSGAGKSTLVRCVMGLELPDAGTVNAGGVDPAIDG